MAMGAWGWPTAGSGGPYFREKPVPGRQKRRQVTTTLIGAFFFFQHFVPNPTTGHVPTGRVVQANAPHSGEAAQHLED